MHKQYGSITEPYGFWMTIKTQSAMIFFDRLFSFCGHFCMIAGGEAGQNPTQFSNLIDTILLIAIYLGLPNNCPHGTIITDCRMDLKLR